MLLAAGCGDIGGDGDDEDGDGGDLQPCAAVPEATLQGVPATLRESGLYAEGSEVLAVGVREFEPAFELWTDGAEKRRFIALPPGTAVDASDPDEWVFPVGTKVWKEFARDGLRVETRLLTKLDARTWQPATYVWRPDQRDADFVRDGLDDAVGTTHDVPAAKDCAACHDGAKDFVLGFSAVQLANTDAEMNLATLVAEGLVQPALDPDALQVPGDATERRALGVLHANCGHCHNSRSRASASQACFTPSDADFELKLYAGDLAAVAFTAAYRTAVQGRDDEALVEPGSPDRSELRERFATRGNDDQMPPLGTESVDEEGLAALDAWIAAL